MCNGARSFVTLRKPTGNITDTEIRRTHSVAAYVTFRFERQHNLHWHLDKNICYRTVIGNHTVNVIDRMKPTTYKIIFKDMLAIANSSNEANVYENIMPYTIQ